ncbi:hypothetical protein [Paenibacillus wynnii]|uniref:Uncharacterized protein n=1 Tax=Paenibacillus wynnii TaxID=268407 RepID=A0A098M5S3_9BACL|nr:hypothetical protein [Paenibacillus wynnii]KGE17904.1 hypothetical protein PWYN_25490 [Paenibacillus wynnii]
MKILLVYFLLGILTASMILAVDLVAGMDLAMEYNTIHAIFVTTTIQEYIYMIVFLSLPFVIAIQSFLKKRREAK